MQGGRKRIKRDETTKAQGGMLRRHDDLAVTCGGTQGCFVVGIDEAFTYARLMMCVSLSLSLSICVYFLSRTEGLPCRAVIALDM